MSQSVTPAVVAPVDPVITSPEPAPHIDMVFKDRFEALTGVRKLEVMTAEAKASLLAVLENSTHTGPVHVVVDPNQSFDLPYVVRPFHFERV